ncbi:MAG: hypothetical protein ACRDXF_08885, partial [Acidimicrobiia bacterium]
MEQPAIADDAEKADRPVEPVGATNSKYLPARRPLKIFAYDPVLGRVAYNRITIDIPNETLQRGPLGRKVDVIDYDSTRNSYYPPVDLD